MSTAVTVVCPLCGLTVLAQHTDQAEAVTQAADVLAQHIDNQHRQENA